MIHHVKRFLILFISVISAGCTKYQYFANQAGSSDAGVTVRPKEPQTLRFETLEYRLIAVESRLVMEIHNPTEDQLQLRGDQSTIVTGDGQTHPLRAIPIAPKAFAKIILPPPRPTMERSGPSITFGGGISSGGYRRWDNDYAYSEGSSYRYYDPNDPYFWDWPVNAAIHLRLTYDRAGKTFTDEIVVEKSKAN